MSKNRFPPGWDEKRVKSVISHYESQSEDEAVAEDEAAMGSTVMSVPAELVPEVRELIAKHKKRA
ncbi:MAG: hypothetical protein L0177_04135 [Chloroflexi bacterium]|nr:hypothetical protein [Chloroflexota bacterium]